MDEKRSPPTDAAPAAPPKNPAAGAKAHAAAEPDLSVEEIESAPGMKEGFTGQER